MPRIPVNSCLRLIKDVVNIFWKCNLEPICVFDGGRHIMKLDTTDDQQAIIDASYAQLRAISRFQDYKEADQLQKKIVYLWADVIALIIAYFKTENIMYYCASYKAEWQCFQLECQRLVSAVASGDGDSFMLVAVILVTLSTFFKYI